MLSLWDKLRWRFQFFSQGVTTHPQALLDPMFWKVLLRSSEKSLQRRTPHEACFAHT